MKIHKNILNQPGVYRIYNSEKSYIGASINMRGRLIKHKSYLKNNVHSNEYLQRAYNSAPESFKIEILKTFDIVDKEELLDYETYFHIKFNSIKKGFNIDLPRKIQNKFSLTKKQINKAIKKSSKSILAFNRYTGKLEYNFSSISEAARQLNGSSSNISQVCKNKLNYAYGYVFCYKENYDVNKNYSFPHDHKKGKPHTKKHVEKLKLNHYKSKKIYKYDLNNVFIEEYFSRSEAERKNNLKKESLRYKVDKTPLGGYYYSYTKN